MKENPGIEKGSEIKAVKYMRFAFIFIATFLLFNPVFTVIDPLPDFIGYIFICLALSRLRDVNSHLSDAAAGFTKLAVLDAMKIPATLLIFSWVTLEERATMLLLACFVFAVGELILITSSWNSFFEGLTVFSQISDGSFALQKNRTVSVRNFTVFFFFLREAMTVLPETAVLTSQGYDESRTDFSEFTSLFRVMGGFVIIIFGIIWLIRITRYLSSLSKDAPMFESARKSYEERIVNKPGIILRRKIRAALTLVSVFLLLSCDFSVDGIGIIPDFLAAAAAIAACLQLRRFSRHWKAGTAVSAVWLITSAASWILSYRFHSVYGDFEVQKSAQAFAAFMKFYPFAIISNVAAVVLSFFILLSAADIVKEHCGYVSMNSSDEYRAMKLREIRKGLNIRLAVCAAFSLLSGVSGIIFPWIITFRNFVPGEIWWLADLCISVLTLVSWLYASSAINAEADSRYMLD
ncbi:MAG: hypothetical protein MJ137_08605 [Clostridia bacterium]|nr:hypothetical protein [Clostridia bacterium]